MTVRSPLHPFLERQGYLVLDGGLATELEAAGHALDTPLWSAQLLLDAPDAIRRVHAAYLEAGADCIGTAGYQVSFEGFERIGLAPSAAEDALRLSVRLAVEARDAFWAEPAHRLGRLEPLVAASVGPYGAFLADGSEYDGRYGVGSEVLHAFHRRRLHVLADTPADLVAFETMPSLLETEVVAQLVADSPDVWAWISFSCRDEERLWDGSHVTEAVAAAGEASGLAALGINCTHPSYVARLTGRIRDASDLPVIVYPNSGEAYAPTDGGWRGAPAGDAWLAAAADWIAAGANGVGGCCRVGPDLIRGLRARLSSTGPSSTLSEPDRAVRRTDP